MKKDPLLQSLAARLAASSSRSYIWRVLHTILETDPSLIYFVSRFPPRQLEDLDLVDFRPHGQVHLLS